VQEEIDRRLEQRTNKQKPIVVNNKIKHNHSQKPYWLTPYY